MLLKLNIYQHMSIFLCFVHNYSIRAVGQYISPLYFLHAIQAQSLKICNNPSPQVSQGCVVPHREIHMHSAQVCTYFDR